MKVSKSEAVEDESERQGEVEPWAHVTWETTIIGRAAPQRWDWLPGLDPVGKLGKGAMGDLAPR